MKFLLFFFICLSINAQEKYSLGFSFGLGKNYYKNSYQTDGNHFKFENPTSISIGSQFIRHLSSKNHIVTKLEYISKKLQFEYNLNEPNIPYSMNEIYTEKYNVISLSFGFRRTILLKKVQTFVEIDFTTDYNLNVAVGSEGEGKGIGDSNIPLATDLLYSNFGKDHLGEKSYTFSNNLSIGFNFGRKMQYELSGNINIPYNKIQKSTGQYLYQWSYDGNEYNHNLDFKGRIIYPSFKFAMYVFNK